MAILTIFDCNQRLRYYNGHAQMIALVIRMSAHLLRSAAILKCYNGGRANGCPWDEITCAWAASNGHLAILQWAYKNGCPWNEETCKYAAGNGHLAVLQWAHENGCPWDKRACLYAAGNGQPLVAIKDCQFATFQWARENGCPWDESICAFYA